LAKKSQTEPRLSFLVIDKSASFGNTLAEDVSRAGLSQLGFSFVFSTTDSYTRATATRSIRRNGRQSKLSRGRPGQAKARLAFANATRGSWHRYMRR